MARSNIRALVIALGLTAPASAFRAGSSYVRPPVVRAPLARRALTVALLPEAEPDTRHASPLLAALPAAAVAASTLLWSAPALAASDAGAVPSALVAYAHFVSLIVIGMSLVTERVVIKPEMSEEDFELAVKADIAYGIAAVVLLASCDTRHCLQHPPQGYARTVAYAKGWDFYSHEPVFWLKLTLFSVMGASSLFPTIKLTQRALAVRGASEGGAVPMLSPKLCKRLTSVINAELLAILAIPLTSTLMARGVCYAEWLPWQAGAAPVFLVSAGLTFKYVKEAVTWKEE